MKTRKPIPAIEPDAHARRFFAALDATIARAKANPVGKRMTAEGWAVAHTGGGCLCWEKVLPSGHYLWICDPDNGLGDRLGEDFLTGLYNADGSSFENGSAKGIEAALIWCKERAADPALFIRRAVAQQRADAAVEAAAQRFVRDAVERYGAVSALSRARIMTHEYRKGHQPKWLVGAIAILTDMAKQGEKR